MTDETIIGWLYGYLLTRRPDVPIYITCAGRTDGMGAQAQAVVSTQALARAMDIPYVHTPFSAMDHSPGDPTDWAVWWESFLNLGNQEYPAQALGLEPIPLPALIWQPEFWNDRPLLVSVCHAHDFTDRFVDSYRLVIPRLREKYNSERKLSLTLPRSLDELSVAIHVRRGDVTCDDHLRYTTDDQVLRVIRRICSYLDHCDLRFRINLYSEGSLEEFAQFEECGCVLHISEDTFFTFHNLVAADVLVMAKSSFSYVAALLSEGVKVYEPFWHPPLSEWVCLGPEETFSEDQFRRMLDQRPISRGLARASGPPHNASVRSVFHMSLPTATDLLEIKLTASNAEGIQNVETGRYGEGMASFVPNFGRQASLSWCVRLASGTYDISGEYAAAESRPVQLLVDGNRITSDALAEPTTGWFEADLQWKAVARIRTQSDAHIISIRCNGPIPHLRQLRLTPV